MRARQIREFAVLEIIYNDNEEPCVSLQIAFPYCQRLSRTQKTAFHCIVRSAYNRTHNSSKLPSMSTSHHNITDQPAQTPDHNINYPAPGISYYTPLQDPPAGTALLIDDQKDVPKLFKPIKLRGVVWFKNRVDSEALVGI